MSDAIGFVGAVLVLWVKLAVPCLVALLIWAVYDARPEPEPDRFADVDEYAAKQRAIRAQRVEANIPDDDEHAVHLGAC